MEMTVPPPPETGSTDCMFMSDFGRPVASWNPVIDMAIALQNNSKQKDRAHKKRDDIMSMLPSSNKCAGVCLIGIGQLAFGGYWDSIGDVPDWILVYVDDAIYDPHSALFILETGSPIIEP